MDNYEPSNKVLAIWFGTFFAIFAAAVVFILCV